MGEAPGCRRLTGGLGVGGCPLSQHEEEEEEAGRKAEPDARVSKKEKKKMKKQVRGGGRTLVLNGCGL